MRYRQGQQSHEHKNMKYMLHTSSDSENMPILLEIEVAGSNGEVRFLTGSS